MSWDLDAFIEKLYRCEILPEHIVKEICAKTKEVLVSEGNIRSVKAPVTVVGDVHGQFYDVLEIFRISGYCPDTSYVFLGDYVDRGYYSVETITLLCCLKLRYPDRITLVRGNHESRAVTQTYGFYSECLKRYGSAAVWNYFTDVFDYLVLGVVIDDAILGVHGGLSPSLYTLDQIRAIDRFQEIPHEGPMADLVWSDPVSSTVTDDKGDFAISPRGAGYIFGKEVTKKFLLTNGLGHICRAHQLCMEGYQILFDDMLSTIWSAPNYCYRAGNIASVLEIDVGLGRTFNVFGPCPGRFRDASDGEDKKSVYSFSSDPFETSYTATLKKCANHITKTYKEKSMDEDTHLIDYFNEKYLATMVTPTKKSDNNNNYLDSTNYSNWGYEMEQPVNTDLVYSLERGGVSETYKDSTPFPRGSSGDDTTFNKDLFDSRRFTLTTRERGVFNPSNVKLMPSSASVSYGEQDCNEWRDISMNVKTDPRNNTEQTVFNQYFAGSDVSSEVSSEAGDHPDHSDELLRFSTLTMEPTTEKSARKAKRAAQPEVHHLIDVDIESKSEYAEVIKHISQKPYKHDVGDFDPTCPTDNMQPIVGASLKRDDKLINILTRRNTVFKGGKWQIPGFAELHGTNGGYGYLPGDVSGEYFYEGTVLRNPFEFELDETGYERGNRMFGEYHEDQDSSSDDGAADKIFQSNDIDEEDVINADYGQNTWSTGYSGNLSGGENDGNIIEMESPVDVAVDGLGNELSITDQPSGADVENSEAYKTSYVEPRGGSHFM